jgi:hypothetical protein
MLCNLAQLSTTTIRTGMPLEVCKGRLILEQEMEAVAPLAKLSPATPPNDCRWTFCLAWSRRLCERCLILPIGSPLPLVSCISTDWHVKLWTYWVLKKGPRHATTATSKVSLHAAGVARTKHHTPFTPTEESQLMASIREMQHSYVRHHGATGHGRLQTRIGYNTCCRYYENVVTVCQAAELLDSEWSFLNRTYTQSLFSIPSPIPASISCCLGHCEREQKTILTSTTILRRNAVWTCSKCSTIKSTNACISSGDVFIYSIEHWACAPSYGRRNGLIETISRCGGIWCLNCCYAYHETVDTINARCAAERKLQPSSSWDIRSPVVLSSFWRFCIFSRIATGERGTQSCPIVDQ